MEVVTVTTNCQKKLAAVTYVHLYVPVGGSVKKVLLFLVEIVTGIRAFEGSGSFFGNGNLTVGNLNALKALIREEKKN